MKGKKLNDWQRDQQAKPETVTRESIGKAMKKARKRPIIKSSHTRGTS